MIIKSSLRLSLAASVLALSAGVAAAQDPVKACIITKTDINPFFVKMKEGAQAQAKKDNVKLLTASGKFDTDNASQVAAMENMTTQGAKGILLVPADSKAVIPAIEKARAAGVTVIALDTPTEPQSAVDALASRMMYIEPDADPPRIEDFIGALRRARVA